MLLNVARRMKNTDDLQWFCFVPIDHQVRIDEKEQMTLVANSSCQWPIPGFFASLTIVVSR